MPCCWSWRRTRTTRPTTSAITKSSSRPSSVPDTTSAPASAGALATTYLVSDLGGAEDEDVPRPGRHRLEEDPPPVGVRRGVERKGEVRTEDRVRRDDR